MNNKKSSEILLGVLCLIYAVYLILSKIGLISDVELDPFDVIITICLIAVMVYGFRGLNWYGIFVPLGGLMTIYAGYLGLAKVEGWVWIVGGFLIAFGLARIFGPAPLEKRRRDKTVENYKKPYDEMKY